jgi:hypothetical protein
MYYIRNMDEYEILVIPKHALNPEKYSMTHSFVPVLGKPMKTFSDR